MLKTVLYTEDLPTLFDRNTKLMEFFTITDPSDWPSSMPELNTIDTLLRCGICYEYFDIAMILPKCSHNYCSMCIRRYMNYKSQCPTCNAPAEASQLCNNRTLDELVTNFKAVRPQILKLCKEESKKSDDGAITSPPSQPVGGKKKAVKETILSPPRKQPGGKKTKKSSPFFKESSNDSDGDFTVESKESANAETPRRKAQRRSNYQHTREKIASHASEQASSSAASPGKTASSSEEDQPTEAGASTGTTSSSSSALNKSNEENIDPTYQIPADGDQSDEDVFAVVTPSKPSTSRGQTDVGPSGDKDATPATRSEKVPCPVCGVPISSKHINVHLDSCLTKSEEKDARRRLPKRKPLPKIVSSLLSDKEMRKKLREHGLNSQGNRSVLNKRLLEFTLMYNAQCDSSHPTPVEAMVKEFNKIDKLKAQPNPVHAEQRLKVTRSLPEDEIAKSQVEYLKSHGSHFRDLIKNTRKRIHNSKKAEEADKDQSGPELPSVNDLPSVPMNDTLPGTSMPIEGDEAQGKNTVCDGVNRGLSYLTEQSSAVIEDLELKQNHEETRAQPGNMNSSDALPVVIDTPTEDDDVVARKQVGGGKSRRLKSKKSRYFADSTKDIKCTDNGVSSQSEDEITVEKTHGEGREEILLDDSIVMATRMDENIEEQMDMTEDEVSPVFGQCSVGSSSSGKALSGSSTKKTDADCIDTLKAEKQKEVVPLSSCVPSPPNTLLLNDIDTISEGSSLVTLESFSEAGSLGDVPSPGDVNCIPESPEAVQGKRPKRIGRRKRKPEVTPEDDGTGSGKETRLTRSRKRGKTSAD